MPHDWRLYFIGPFLLAAFLAYFYDRRSGKRETARVGEALARLGAGRPIHFGLCLGGLPGLPKPAPVYAGLRADELVFVTGDGTEVGRIPRAAIQVMLPGDWEEVGPYMEISREPIGLAERVGLLLSKRHHAVGYLVLEWRNAQGESKKVLFRHPSRESAERMEQTFQLHLKVAEMASTLGVAATQRRS